MLYRFVFLFNLFQLFITAMDRLRLGMKAVDEIEPDLRDLVENMTKMSNLPDDYEGKEKIANWYGLRTSSFVLIS